ncbi:MAG: helix-turn-helix transcriptional regulator [Nostoc sp. C3-bin3]|nr:helix-turn-helix transcriptional regulator [Nostoc sp. C3-bin3]
MPAIEQPRIAQLVRKTRQCLKLSQVKLATMLGVSFHSINRWENGRAQPSPLAMKQINLGSPIFSRRQDGVLHFII